MRRQLYFIGAWFLVLVLACATRLPALDTDSEFDAPRLPHRKGPSIFHKPEKKSSAEQLAHADALRADGHSRKAMKQYSALVHAWHDSREAPTAQQAYAELLVARRKYADAFDEFQYLIDNYAGLFPYDEVLEQQFRIANYIMTARHARFFFFPGFEAPERALPMFEKIVNNAPGWNNAANAQFKIGAIREEMKDYILAAEAYRIIGTRYPDSLLAEEASFRRAKCLYLESNTRPRDESGCRNAITALAEFVSGYPGSSSKPVAETYLDEIKERLIAMHYERAAFYDKIAKRPKSAIIAYRDFVRKFPGSKQAAEASIRIEVLEAAMGEDR